MMRDPFADYRGSSTKSSDYKEKKKKKKTTSKQTNVKIFDADEHTSQKQSTSLTMEDKKRMATDEALLNDEDEDYQPVVVQNERVDAHMNYLERKKTKLSTGQWRETSPIRTNTKRSASPDRGDISPPRRTRHDSDDDEPSAPKRRRHDSDDEASPIRGSPPRKQSRDLSPPRKSRDVDLSPPRSRRRDDDLSPPRSRKDADLSPPRRRDLSPPRRRAASQRDRDLSPPRRKDDLSPPRKKRREDEDLSPPRHRSRNDDLSPPRRSRNDLSPPRRRHDSPPPKHESQDDSKPQTVYRDAETGRRITYEEYTQQRDSQNRKKKKDADKKKKVIIHKQEDMLWGAGLAQKAQEQRFQQQMQEAAEKPFARYENDQDLDSMYKDQVREGDPMAHLVKKKKKKKKHHSSDEDDFVRPMYRGNCPPNRFGILPGHRWDGVDRSNGFERKFIQSVNKSKALQEEAHKWSTEDM